MISYVEIKELEENNFFVNIIECVILIIVQRRCLWQGDDALFLKYFKLNYRIEHTRNINDVFVFEMIDYRECDKIIKGIIVLDRKRFYFQSEADMINFQTLYKCSN